jgi:hypothetical protein
MSLNLSSTSCCDHRCTTVEASGSTAPLMSATPAKPKLAYTKIGLRN